MSGNVELVQSQGRLVGPKLTWSRAQGPGACWAGCPKGQRWSVQGPKQVQAPWELAGS